MNQDDINADVEMCFRQILSISDLMLECNNQSIPNILTIRDLAQTGIDKIINI